MGAQSGTLQGIAAALDSPTITQTSAQGDPSKRAVLALMRQYARPDDRLAAGMIVSDLSAFLALSFLSAAAEAAWMKLALAPVIALFIGRLYVIAHDADHGAFTSSDRANRLIGLVAFLPGFVPMASWTMGHNAHHSFANVLSLDPSLSPMTPEQYRKASPFKRWVERTARRPFGQGVFMALGFVQMTLKPLVGLSWRPWRRLPALVRDALIQLGYIAALVVVLVGLALASHGAVTSTLLLTGALPVMLWLSTSGLIAYLQHNDPDIEWYRNEVGSPWENFGVSLEGTTCVRFPLGLDRALHDVMEHVPHHLNVKIPCYRLRAARQALEAYLPKGLIHRPLTWQNYRRATRLCKLYDPVLGTWVGFEAAGVDSRVRGKQTALKQPAE